VAELTSSSGDGAGSSDWCSGCSGVGAGPAGPTDGPMLGFAGEKGSRIQLGWWLMFRPKALVGNRKPFLL
jgi:hypothetical protein